MNATELKSRAQRLLNRLNALGVTKADKPLVIDQVYELVAAEEGFRNQHALRAKLDPSPTSVPVPNNMLGYVLVPRNLDPEFAKAVLVQHSLDENDELFAQEAWDHLVAESDKRYGCRPQQTIGFIQEQEFRSALNWLADRFEAALASRPVRDADECLSHARKLLATIASQPEPPVVNNAVNGASASRDSVDPNAPWTPAQRRWLQWLEAALRMAGIDESDLDETVHEFLDGETASVVNNQGLGEQLSALLRYFGTKPGGGTNSMRINLVKRLELDIEGLSIPLPQSVWAEEDGSVASEAMRARVSIHADSRFEEVMQVDVLEWFAQAGENAVEDLMADGLMGTEATEQVVLWLAENSLNGQTRPKLQALLRRMKERQESHPSLVGLTVNIDHRGLEQFLRTTKGRITS